MLERFDKDQKYHNSMVDHGWTRDQIAKQHRINLEEYHKRQQEAAMPRQERDERYGRWRNTEEMELRRVTHIPRQWEWTSRQWSDWLKSQWDWRS